MQRVGIVGLGVMGLPMALTLRAKGFDVTGVDLSPARRAQLPGAVDALVALHACEVVVLSLPAAAQVQPVVTALLDIMRPGSLIADTSTVAPETTRTLHADAAAKQIGYVDAPVSGGAAGAAAGTLLVMAGGTAADLDRAAPVLAAIARKVVRCGGSGCGNTVKLINNMLCAGHLMLAGEALRLAETGHVAATDLLDALNAGSGRSAVTEINLPRWVLPGTFDSGFTMGLMNKDVGLAHGLDGAGEITALIASGWAAATAAIGGQEDFNRVVTGAQS